VSLVQSTLEAINFEAEYDVALINISMHECRDVEQVTANVHRALKSDGYFVISDFPFPESVEACHTVLARIMYGIQFFEALVGDQLLPTADFEELLKRHGF
jgi:ubiquinone/menaquinone biosynthesis C-methylase UbiE